MKFRDSFRVQYYLGILEREISNANLQFFQTHFFTRDFLSILCDFSLELSEELDQLLLPSIVHEIHKSKQQGSLEGSTSFERYKSFFLNHKGYTPQAYSFIEQYPYLFEMIDKITVRSFSNLINCLKKFELDFEEIKKHFNISPECLIDKIKILSSSDRHRNQQSLLIFLSDKTKLIYKPVDLHLDELFEEFIKNLELPDSFNLLCRKILPKHKYGWLEYISPNVCESIDEVRCFYNRAGVLLAIADTLNYSDGHCENILAHGSFPILLDGETLFQNYAMPIHESKSIISTQLIQKFTKKQKNKINYSAFQSNEEKRFESLFTHAINDQTDDIRVSYSGYSHELNHHRPIFREKFCNSHDFLEEIINGFCFCYDLITKKTPQLLKNISWWDKIVSVHSRMVIRDTSAYFYLQRRIQQPEYCKSRKKAENFIRNKLGDTPYTEYEVKDILELNIPYFYQKPGEKHLYDGKDKCYADVFPKTAIDWLTKHLKDRSEDKKLNDCKLIRKYLSKKTQTLVSTLS